MSFGDTTTPSTTNTPTVPKWLTAVLQVTLALAGIASVSALAAVGVIPGAAAVGIIGPIVGIGGTIGAAHLTPNGQ
jgi:hypothetical protein